MRILLIVVILTAAAGIVAWSLHRERKRCMHNVAEYAPEMLTKYDVPQPVIDYIIEQRKQLEDGRRIVQDILTANPIIVGLPPNFTPPPAQEWLNATQQKGITQ